MLKDLEQNNKVCPCEKSHHFRVSPEERIKMHVDADSFPEIEPKSGVPFKTIRGSIKNEFEILFPRDIVFALIRIDHEEVEINDKGEREVYPIYVLSIHLINPNQYTTDERIRKSMRESYDERYIINSTDKHLSLLVE